LLFHENRFPNIEGSGELYLDVMRAICAETSQKSVLDLLCHRSPYTPQLGFRERTYVDIQNRPLDFKEEQQYFIQKDVFDYLHTTRIKQFDVVICADGIEHLSEEKADKLIAECAIVAEKRVFFTPLGDCMLSDDDHPDSHRSGWTPEKITERHSGGWGFIVFPDFHPTLNQGAFFFWTCDSGIEKDFNE
jgi:hypothetical protein